MRVKIISGGQTGVDRAALDVGLKHGLECDGWCPEGRLDEFGKIPERYPVKELEHGGFSERTLGNVKDSDGTVIIYFSELQGGTEYTLECCTHVRRPCQLIDAAKTSVEDGANVIARFVREHKVGVLNVAGPRHSEWSGGYEYAFRVLESFLNSIMSTSTSTSRKKAIIRISVPSPDRVARRNTRGSKQRKSRSRTR
jgi:Circularly permutated YpsA SLOG family